MKVGVDYTGNCVVFFCHDGQGNFLMAYRGENCRDERNTWDIGGGKIEPHEEVEAALRAEILQEYTTKAIEIEFLGYRDVHRINHEGERTHWVALDFKVLVDPSLVSNGETHKFREVKWFTEKTVPPASELHSTVPVIFEKYRKKLFR